MKVLAALVLIVSSASALGSGPYLYPRPDGPAFDLPSRPVAAGPIDIILHGSEASSSDFLREYGPPKIQSLPEVATEQSLVALAARFSEEEKDTEVVEAATEVITDLKYAVVEEISSATETAAPELITEAVQQQDLTFEGRSSNLDVEASLAEVIETTEVTEVETEKIEVDNVEITTTSEVETSELIEEVKTIEIKEQVVEEEVKTVEEGVKNIEQAIVGLQKEVLAQEVQLSQELAEIKSVELSPGLVEVSEGFLEYGPPGFREYGPPNQDNVLRTAEQIAEDVKSEDEKIENNETRKRRFSPKFKSIKARKH